MVSEVYVLFYHGDIMSLLKILNEVASYIMILFVSVWSFYFLSLFILRRELQNKTNTSKYKSLFKFCEKKIVKYSLGSLFIVVLGYLLISFFPNFMMQKF